MSEQGTRGLSHGKNWGALPRQGEDQEWCMAADGPMIQGPIALEEYRGRRVVLHLQPGQYGLLVVDEKLRAVYLDGSHHLEIGTGHQQVPTAGRLILLSSLEGLDLRFAGSEALHTADGTGVIARCSLRLARPALFYHRILRPAGRDWSSDSLLAVLTPVARQAFQEILDGLGEDGISHAGALQSELMDLKPGRLDEYLEPSGLYCASVAAYTDALPVEDSPDAGSPDPESLQSQELLHN